MNNILDFRFDDFVILSLNHKINLYSKTIEKLPNENLKMSNFGCNRAERLTDDMIIKIKDGQTVLTDYGKNILFNFYSKMYSNFITIASNIIFENNPSYTIVPSIDEILTMCQIYYDAEWALVDDNNILADYNIVNRLLEFYPSCFVKHEKHENFLTFRDVTKYLSQEGKYVFGYIHFKLNEFYNLNNYCVLKDINKRPDLQLLIIGLYPKIFRYENKYAVFGKKTDLIYISDLQEVGILEKSFVGEDNDIVMLTDEGIQLVKYYTEKYLNENILKEIRRNKNDNVIN